MGRKYSVHLSKNGANVYLQNEHLRFNSESANRITEISEECAKAATWFLNRENLLCKIDIYFEKVYAVKLGKEVRGEMFEYEEQHGYGVSINLSKNKNTQEILIALFHELRHVYQFENKLFISESTTKDNYKNLGREKDARKYMKIYSHEYDQTRNL